MIQCPFIVKENMAVNKKEKALGIKKEKKRFKI
jgi:hypothetical protein